MRWLHASVLSSTVEPAGAFPFIYITDDYNYKVEFAF